MKVNLKLLDKQARMSAVNVASSLMALSAEYERLSTEFNKLCEQFVVPVSADTYLNLALTTTIAERKPCEYWDVWDRQITWLLKRQIEGETAFDRVISYASSKDLIEESVRVHTAVIEHADAETAIFSKLFVKEFAQRVYRKWLCSNFARDNVFNYVDFWAPPAVSDKRYCGEPALMKYFREAALTTNCIIYTEAFTNWCATQGFSPMRVIAHLFRDEDTDDSDDYYAGYSYAEPFLHYPSPSPAPSSTPA